MSLMVSVIIPTFRDWKTLNACLKQLNHQTLSSSLFEVVVVNNDPSDSIPEGLQISPTTRVISESRPGSYAARNKGMNESNAELIAFTDSDCLPALDWLEKGVELLVSGFDMVGGKVELFKPQDGDDLAFIYENKFGFNQKRNVEEKGQSITANFFCTRKVLETIGPFPEGLMSGGDFEWTKKATKSGFKMAYGEGVIVKHPTRKSIGDLVKKKKRTIGGMYSRFYRGYSTKKKFKFAMHFLRPHVSIFAYKDLSWTEKTKLFFATWYVECMGMKEMLLLDFQKKSAERS